MHIDPPSIPPDFSTYNAAREQYRLYCLDRDSHIKKSFEFHARDDAEAIRVANAWRDGGKAELWCRGRIVHHWESGRR